MFKEIIVSGSLYAMILCLHSNMLQVIKKTEVNTCIIKNYVRETHASAVIDTNDLPLGFSQFIPQDYSMLDTASGDLNLDSYPDIILILKKNGEDTTSDVIEHPEKRPLLILTGQADGLYKLAARNDNAVYCVDCGGIMGDPYTGITIKKGYFSVEHEGGSSWRWTRIITFKYSPADHCWYLYKDGGDSFHTSDPENIKTTVKTTKNFGKVPFNKFDIYKED
jgi:hypothetical protein